ncbi:purine-cytosine permease family protein [Devosia sp. XGJD_8]|uniref:purine-cytosine permease family protein n=1 Tax=Devosia sp. XGJD_8 TaxID=3391187 RepID=UPI0039853E91
MTAQSKVTRVRRTYNKWVANQTLEDFALRFTAQKVRRWSPARIANTAIGAASFLALEAIGGALTLSYGFSVTAWAVLSTSIIIFCMGIPIVYNAAKYGVDIDLLSRGAGFGYLGSTITSLVYASFTFIFFAIEAAIMATALELCFGLPMSIGYLVSALVVIPLVTYGITLINRFQTWTQPFWIVLQLVPFVFIGAQSLPAVRDWSGYTGLMGPVDGSSISPCLAPLQR